MGLECYHFLKYSFFLLQNYSIVSGLTRLLYVPGAERLNRVSTPKSKGTTTARLITAEKLTRAYISSTSILDNIEKICVNHTRQSRSADRGDLSIKQQ